jgi:ribosomal protein L7/L12
MNDDIEESISTGHKINAIKIYRQQMDDIYGVKVNLREAKDYIDNIQADMKRRGMV